MTARRIGIPRLGKRKRRWKRVRFAGWGLLAIARVMTLFEGGAVTRDPLAITGVVVAVTGILLVAVGFERILELQDAESGG